MFIKITRLVRGAMFIKFSRLVRGASRFVRGAMFKKINDWLLITVLV